MISLRRAKTTRKIANKSRVSEGVVVSLWVEVLMLL